MSVVNHIRGNPRLCLRDPMPLVFDSDAAEVEVGEVWTHGDWVVVRVRAFDAFLHWIPAARVESIVQNEVVHAGEVIRQEGAG